MKDILDIKLERRTLDNGLEVVLYPDNSLPIVSVNIWYKVGSAYEEKGKTGFAHLFEHMMFQGSENVPKEKHFHYIQEAGGTLNGSTSIDRTNYYETLPANELELALWLESDRMGFLLPGLTQEKLDNQREVVMNERRQRYDNQPYGRAWEILFSNLYPENHPYHWPTIGWAEDIERYELKDVRNFFKKYYAPNNASLVIGGDIEIEKAFDLTRQYFGEIPKGADVKPPESPDFVIDETKKIIEKDEVQLPRVYLAWKSDKFFGEDDASLDLLADILSGSKNSRLFKSLVFEKQIAQDVTAFNYSGKFDGSFIVIATAKPGINIDDLKNEILFEIENLINAGIKKDELLRAKNSVKSSFIYSLQKMDSLVNQINVYNCNLGEPNSFLLDLARYEVESAENIREKAEKYLKKNYVELQITPNGKND